MICSKFMSLFKRRLKIGQRIAVILYKGTCYDDADQMRKYLQTYKDNKELLLVEDAKGNDVFVKVDDINFEVITDQFNNLRYTVILKGEISND